MVCPHCNHLNLPGADLCVRCLFGLASIDQPVPQDKIEASLMADTVQVLGPKPPVTVSADATLGEAMALMFSHGVGALLVTGPGRELQGILTERDFLTKVAGDADFERRPVREVMTLPAEGVRPQDTLAFAVRKMSVGGYRHMPVVQDGIPVGVFSVRDLLKHVTRLCSPV